MAFLAVFNGRETFQDAFTWDHNQIIAFFNRVSANPTFYNVETRSQETIGTICYCIVGLMASISRTTLFDLIGWVFSVTGTSPPNATPSNYYYPLTALYAQFCSIGCGDLTTAPGVVQLTYFQQESVMRAALGATLVAPPSSKNAARRNRFNQMKAAKTVSEPERNESHVPGASTSTGEPTYKQLFGHCAETWPFLYINVRRNEITLGSARGWASNTAEYVMETGFQYSEQDIVASLGNACQNCQRLIQRIQLIPDNFRPVRTTSEMEAQAVSDDGGEHPSHAN